MIRQIALFILCLTLTGCGYQWGNRSPIGCYRTISVPFIGGDKEGELTNALVHEIEKSGVLHYSSSGAELVLQVCLFDLREENVGFRYDLDSKGRRTHSLIPIETRITAVAQVEVRQCGTGCVVMGPVKIEASLDFDHDYYASPTPVNIFSLGQVNDYDNAKDIAQKPLFRRLASKIVDYLVEGW